MLDPYSLSVFLFFIILGILIYKDRKNIEIKYILVMKRTKRFRNLIDKIAKLSPIFWKAVGTVAFLVCLFYMVQGTYILFTTQPAVQFVLPTPTATGASGQGYILIPFWFWIITIFSILVPHELFHGIMARAEKIKLKSVGLLLLAIFPGAFVEPDEKEIKKSKTLTKLRIFSMGSFANFLVSFIVFYTTLYLIWPLSVSPGIKLINVTEGSPADLAGLKPGMILTEINNNKIIATYTEYLNGSSYFINELINVKPNDTVIVKANESYYSLKLGFNEKTNSTYMGITYTPMFNFNPEFFLGILIPLLTMISLFSLAVGIVNILPIYPLDGGLIVQTIAERFSKKKAKQITKIITYLVLIVLAYSFLKQFML
ncbi:MAG: site-2 protease family protein [Candidatus Aenigmatarchaeota archaeon]